MNEIVLITIIALSAIGIIAALILYGLAGTAGFVLNSLIAILISRGLLGLAVAGIMSGFTTLILDYFRDTKLNQFMGYQAAFIGIGGMVFLLAAGFLADIGWRFPFLVHLFAFLVLPGVLIPSLKWIHHLQFTISHYFRQL